LFLAWWVKFIYKKEVIALALRETTCQKGFSIILLIFLIKSMFFSVQWWNSLIYATIFWLFLMIFYYEADV